MVPADAVVVNTPQVHVVLNGVTRPNLGVHDLGDAWLPDAFPVIVLGKSSNWCYVMAFDRIAWAASWRLKGA